MSKSIPANELCFSTQLKFSADGEAPSSGDRKFGGVAYSGNEITDHAWWQPRVIFDLSTTRAPAVVPVLFAHDDRMPIGRTENVTITDHIAFQGIVYDDEDGRKVIDKKDHPWEVSVGIRPGRIEELAEGVSVVVNGKTFTGPGFVFRDNLIREISIVSFGADPNTHAALFSGQNETVEIECVQIKQELSMTEEQIREMQARVAALEAENTAFKAAAEQRAKADRQAKVTDLFAATGLEMTEQATAPYMAMTDEVFSAVSANFRAVKPTTTPAQKEQLPAHLFREQAVAPAGAEAPTNALLANAARRAAAAGTRK